MGLINEKVVCDIVLDVVKPWIENGVKRARRKLEEQPNRVKDRCSSSRKSKDRGFRESSDECNRRGRRYKPRESPSVSRECSSRNRSRKRSRKRSYDRRERSSNLRNRSAGRYRKSRGRHARSESAPAPREDSIRHRNVPLRHPHQTRYFSVQPSMDRQNPPPHTSYGGQEVISSRSSAGHGVAPSHQHQAFTREIYSPPYPTTSPSTTCTPCSVIYRYEHNTSSRARSRRPTRRPSSRENTKRS